jgi:Fe-S-cluster containining protein
MHESPKFKRVRHIAPAPKKRPKTCRAYPAVIQRRKEIADEIRTGKKIALAQGIKIPAGIDKIEFYAKIGERFKTNGHDTFDAIAGALNPNYFVEGLRRINKISFDSLPEEIKKDRQLLAKFAGAYPELPDEQLFEYFKMFAAEQRKKNTNKKN